jgi:ankyrin repeat protein
MENGADLTAKSNNGWTLLHFAAANYSIEVVKFLVGEKEFGRFLSNLLTAYYFIYVLKWEVQ